MANGVENTTDDLEEKDPIIVEENNDSEENQDSNINEVKITPISEETPMPISEETPTPTDDTEQTNVESSEKMTWDSGKNSFVKENGDYLAKDRWGNMVWYNIDGKELNPDTTPNPEWMYDHPDDEDEIENYTNKNVHGGEGGHYKREPVSINPNRTRFAKFEENMKKSDIYNLVKESIKEVLQEVGANAYGSATNLTKGLNVAKSRFTKTGRPPGILDEEDALVTRGKIILQVLNEPGNEGKKETFDNFIKDRTNGKFGLPNKINDKTDGDILALMSLRAKDFGDVFRKAKYFN